MPDEHVSIPVAGGTMRASLCRPAGNEPAPAVLVVHEIYGLTPHIEDVARRLCAEGFVALAPDLFWQLDELPSFTDRASFGRFRQSLDDRQMLASLDAAVSYLEEQPFVRRDRIGIVGFCMGGYYAFLETVHNQAIAACVDFYGAPLVRPEPTERAPRAPMEAAAELRVPFLGLFGEEDASIPVEQLRQFEGVVARTGVPHEFHVYPGAGHAFHNDTGPMYRAEAARDAWRRTVEFFGRYLKG
jgi:carboxymethylenebutenolidase